MASSNSGKSPPGPEGTDPFLDRPDGALTPEQAAAIAAWCAAAAPLLGLHGWRIRVSTHEANPETSASSSVRVDSDEAWIAVERRHHEVPAELRRTTLTHELLHLHLQPVLQPIMDLLDENVSQPVSDATRTLLRGGEERMIERLANAIAVHLPLPPEL